MSIIKLSVSKFPRRPNKDDLYTLPPTEQLEMFYKGQEVAIEADGENAEDPNG